MVHGGGLLGTAGGDHILRYTVIFNDIEDYCDGAEDLLNGLMEKFGGKLDKFRNYWTPYVKGDYKGLNTVVTLPEMRYDTREGRICDEKSGNSRFIVDIPAFGFEIQFHTKKSLEVKFINHDIYEETRGNSISQEQRDEKELEMMRNMKQVPAPENAEYLNRYSKEYVIALQRAISLMENELETILASEPDMHFIDDDACPTREWLEKHGIVKK